MAHLLALQWNSDRAHLVDATTKGSDVVIQRLATLDSAAGDLREQITSTIQGWRIGKAAALVAIGRDECELRVLQVPPVPADELPDIVRFQSMQQFSTLGDDWPLDFVPITSDPVHDVLAAATPPATLKDIEAVCEAAEVQLTGAILRPCGTAMVADRAAPSKPGSYRLIVDIIGGRADLVVAHRSSVLMSRSLQLSNHGDDVSGQLMGEVRRTLASCRSQFPDATVDHIVICGTDEKDKELQSQLTESLKLRTECIAPFAGFSLSSELQKTPPENASSFVPLLGLLLEEVTAERHAIDFVRPRRPEPPKDTRQFWMGMATLALLAIFLGGVAWWWMLGQRDAELVRMRRQINEQDELVKKARAQQDIVDELDDWYEKSPNWLNELVRLSKELPPPEKVRLTSLQAMVRENRGIISLTGYSDSSATVTDLENRLRDGNHSTSGAERSQRKDDPTYPWYFSERIDIRTNAALPAAAKNAPDASKAQAGDGKKDNLATPKNDEAAEQAKPVEDESAPPDEKPPSETEEEVSS